MARLVETGAEQRTDADGRFVFRNLKPGVYHLTVAMPGRRLERVIVVPEGPAVVKVELDLN
jgi:protocatechuate 3,4-dioxygenase beta subunit